jgi:membrane-associated phospholipid phosphatase
MRRRLTLAALCAAAAACVYVAALYVPAVRAADLRVLQGFLGLAGFPGREIATVLSYAFNPLPFAVLAGALLLTAARAGRRRAALATGAAMLGALVTTELLKPLLGEERPYLGAGTWPSGHATAVMTFALALALLAPPRLRTAAVASGGLLTVATVYSMLLLGSHYPSDVAGGLLVATGWMSLAADRVPSVAGPVRAALVLVAGAAAFVIVAPAEVAAYAQSHTTFVAGALAIAAAALVLSGSVPAPTAAHPGPPPR